MASKSFVPFDQADFGLTQQVTASYLPPQLEEKIDALRSALGEYPEFRLVNFKRIVRRGMRGQDGKVFTRAKKDDHHWYLFNSGGDQDQVQLNIGMWSEWIRVGLGFQIGRQVTPKIPAFHVFQTLLGSRPALPFRGAFRRCIEQNNFGIQLVTSVQDQIIHGDSPDRIMQQLEEFVVPADRSAVFVFIGALWNPDEASGKTEGDFRRVFRELLPFYETLILMGGRFAYYEEGSQT